MLHGSGTSPVSASSPLWQRHGPSSKVENEERVQISWQSKRPKSEVSLGARLAGRVQRSTGSKAARQGALRSGSEGPWSGRCFWVDRRQSTDKQLADLADLTSPSYPYRGAAAVCCAVLPFPLFFSFPPLLRPSVCPSGCGAEAPRRRFSCAGCGEQASGNAS